jgi:hypothetical protein
MTTGSYDTLSGSEKAAILMLSLTEEHAARLFSMLEIDEVMELSGIMEQTHLKGSAPPGRTRVTVAGMDRPLTVAGLLAKRKELAALRSTLEAELRRVTCDLDHLDATVLLFGPDAKPATALPYKSPYRTPQGHLQRFVLGFLREASAPARPRRLPRRG